MSKARSLSKIANDTPTGIANELAPLRDWRSKNALINGNFDIWQRGVSFTTAGYTADRWQSFFSTGAGTITRQEFPPGFTDVPGNPRFYFRHDRDNPGSALSNLLSQKIESVRTFEGQVITLSFWSRALSGSKTFAVRFSQSFGTGGSPSGAVVLTSQPFVATTSWQKFTFTFSIPSISGKTIGTNNNDFLFLEFLEESNLSTFTLDVAQIQVELGPVATTFENRPFGTELALCQRYFEKTMDVNTVPANGVAGGANGGMTVTVSATTFSAGALWKFAVSKRTNPSIVTYGYGIATSNTWRDIDNTANGPTITAINGGTEGVILTASSTTWPRADAAFVAHATADAEL